MGLTGTWLFKAVGLAHQLLCRLIGQSPRQDAQTWYCESGSGLGWKAYFVADLSAAGDSISSSKIRCALLPSNSDCGNVRDIDIMGLSPMLLLDLVERGLVMFSRRV
jgi:hypothetical protein